MRWARRCWKYLQKQKRKPEIMKTMNKDRTVYSLFHDLQRPTWLKQRAFFGEHWKDIAQERVGLGVHCELPDEGYRLDLIRTGNSYRLSSSLVARGKQLKRHSRKISLEVIAFMKNCFM